MSDNHEATQAVPADQSKTNASPSVLLRMVKSLLRMVTLVAIGVLLVAFYLMPQQDRRYLVGFVSSDLAARMPNGQSQMDVTAHESPTSRNGFDYANATIPIEEILGGGPPRDGIPALTEPDFVTAESSDWVFATDRVIGVSIEGESRAYPLRILDQHEIVNDIVAGVPVAVTYCPLCDSAVVFDRRIDDETIELGVSGLLYNSNVLMYDRRPDGDASSLWSQLACKAVAGPLAGKQLKVLPVTLTTWQRWQEGHPDSKVLSQETGLGRHYEEPAYGRYFASEMLMFPVEPLDNRLPLKTPVFVAWTDSTKKVLPVSAVLDASSDGLFRTTIAGKKVELQTDQDSGTVHVVSAEPGLQWAYTFWFAWQAFHPESELFSVEHSIQHLDD